MKKGTPTIRITVLGAIILACLGVLVGRLWWVQVVMGDYYASKVQGGSRVTVRLPAVRGEILDRNGIPLVQNSAGYELDFYLPDIVSAYQKKHDGKLPLQSYRRVDRRGNPVEEKEANIAEVVRDVMVERLQDLDLAQDYNSERMQIHWRNERLIPFTYREDLTKEEIMRFLEYNVSLPGLKAEIKPIRNYPYGSLASHLLGYVGAPSDIGKQRRTEEEAGREYNFYQPDMEGKSQIEKAMDPYLRGKPGTRVLQRDAKGRILEGDVQLEPPVKGNDVYLTIDARLQYIVEDTLRVAGRAAAVVIDVNNGDILAMASVPSFDPNKFIPSIAAQDWADLTNDETAPLLNRAINPCVPGSTYKVVTALAGLRAGIGDRRFTCSGGVSYGNHFMKCWIFGKGSHGTLDLEGGLKNSCNAFFAQYANAAGIDNLVAIGNMLGLGQLTGIPLSGENPGILDGPEHLARVSPREKWRPGLTANVSIGQGQVLATPLQMAIVTATIANGGTCYYPRLVDKVVDANGRTVFQEPAKVRSNLIQDGGITPEGLEHVRRGMWKVVNEAGGTARKARIAGIEVCGKTGTAQNWRVTKEGQRVKDNNTLFIAFAPYDQPKYAICVLVQGGKSGGGVAAPVAGKILEEAFELEKGELKVEMAALEPAIGNFKQIESIDFGGDVPAVSSSDTETVEDVASSPVAISDTATAAASAAPSIRAEPDAGGRVERPRKEKKGLLNFFNFGGGNKKTDSDSSPRRSPFRR